MTVATAIQQPGNKKEQITSLLPNFCILVIFLPVLVTIPKLILCHLTTWRF